MSLPKVEKPLGWSLPSSHWRVGTGDLAKLARRRLPRGAREVGMGVPWTLGPGGLVSLGSSAVQPHSWVSQAWLATARGHLWAHPCPGHVVLVSPEGRARSVLASGAYSPEFGKQAPASFSGSLQLRDTGRLAAAASPVCVGDGALISEMAQGRRPSSVSV